MSIFAIIAIILGVAASATMIDSGGGGSSSGSSSNAVSNGSWVNIVDADIRSSYITAEYNGNINEFSNINQPAYELINLSSSYSLLQQNSKNIAGDNIVVAVMDSGIALNHDEFSNQIVNFPDIINRDYVNNDNDVTDDSGHGSHVSGIIAANRDNVVMHGIAFNSNIAAYKVLDFEGNGDAANIASAINQAVSDEVDIINLSLGGGSGDNDLRNALINAANNDILIFAATGNDSLTQPDYPAYYAIDSELQNHVIAVGSVDNNSNQSSFSNDCGNIASYCLMAPGEDILSPVEINDNYSISSGTSMATPMAASAAALIRSAWPHLTASQTAQILLQTATDIGNSGIDANNGVGLLNIQNAVNSIGSSYVPSAFLGSNGYDISQSNLFTSAIFGDAFIHNIMPTISDAVFFDDFGRDYQANLDQRIAFRRQKSILSNIIFNQNQIKHFIHNNNLHFELKITGQTRQTDLMNNKQASNYFGIENFIYDYSDQNFIEDQNQNLSFLYEKKSLI